MNTSSYGHGKKFITHSVRRRDKTLQTGPREAAELGRGRSQVQGRQRLQVFTGKAGWGRMKSGAGLSAYFQQAQGHRAYPAV